MTATRSGRSAVTRRCYRRDDQWLQPEPQPPPARAATASPSPVASSFAWKDEPQPHAATTFGLLIANPPPIRASTKSSSEPRRYGALYGSTTVRTPLDSSWLSPSCGPRSKPSAYWKPEHPPPWIATRSTSASPAGSWAASSLNLLAAV